MYLEKIGLDLEKEKELGCSWDAENINKLWTWTRKCVHAS